MKKILRKTYYKVTSALLKPLIIPSVHSGNINECLVQYEESLRIIKQVYVHQNNTVLDVGTGKSSWPHLLSMMGFDVTAIDNTEAGFWDIFFNAHYPIQNDDICYPTIKGSFDIITCLSTVAHISNHQMAINQMYNLLSDHGHLIIATPYNEMIYHPNVYDSERCEYGDKLKDKFFTQSINRHCVNEWMDSTQLTILSQKYYKVFTGELWGWGERMPYPIEVTKKDEHQFTIILFNKS